MSFHCFRNVPIGFAIIQGPDPAETEEGLSFAANLCGAKYPGEANRFLEIGTSPQPSGGIFVFVAAIASFNG